MGVDSFLINVFGGHDSLVKARESSFFYSVQSRRQQYMELPLLAYVHASVQTLGNGWCTQIPKVYAT